MGEISNEVEIMKNSRYEQGLKFTEIDMKRWYSYVCQQSD